MIKFALRQTALAALALGIAAPALAQPLPPPPPPPGAVDADGNYYGDEVPPPMPEVRREWHGVHPPMPGQPMPGGYDPASYEQARADWLAECRHNHGNGNAVGGAVVGGIVGGVIGNRVAGSGNRAVGTVVGGVVGAAAGAAIGSAADRRAARDWCEAYLDSHMNWQGGYGQPGYGYGYGYAPMTVMVPVAYVPQQGPRECTTTVTTEEYVTETPRRTRAVRLIRPLMPQLIRPVPAPKPVPDKRVRTN